MGTEGEYDPSGLAKRVAIALNDDPEVEDIETLQIIQSGSTIRLKGEITNSLLLDHIVERVSCVDGTKSVDITQVTVASE